MSSTRGITFVYRSSYEGAMGRHVMELPDKTVLAFFRRALTETAGKDADAWLKKTLGCDVYGLDSFFEGGGEDDEDGEDGDAPSLPKNTRELRALLDENLYTEGEFRLDDHSLRVLTDDDEVQLAYFFYDKSIPPDRVDWLEYDSLELPGGFAKKSTFKSPVPCSRILPAARGGEGSTWACLLTFYDSESIPYDPPSVFTGVRLPELAAHLRNTVPKTEPRKGGGEFQDTWPFELRLLRSMIDAKDSTIVPALERCAKYPVLSVGGSVNTTVLGAGAHSDARPEFLKVAEKMAKPPGGMTSSSPHAVMLNLHVDKGLGWQQWVLFDDLWAARNEDLASSLLRYACRWDPLK